MSASARVSASRNQLAARPYAISAGEFVRFGVDTNDDVVAGVVRAVVAEGARAATSSATAWARRRPRRFVSSQCAERSTGDASRRWV